MSYVRALRSTTGFHKKFTQNSSLLFESTPQVTWTGTKSGENVPHWRDKIFRGVNASGTYSLDMYSIRKSEGAYTLYSHDLSPVPVSMNQTFEGINRAPPATLSHAGTNLAKANAAALKQVYSKLAEERSHVNSLAMLGEIGGTLRMLGNPFRSIAELTTRHINRLLKYKRGLVGSEAKKRESYYEVVRGTYLEYSFGLAPLISDTRGLAETIARWQAEASGEKIPRERIVGRGSDEIVTSSFTPYATTGLGNPGLVYNETEVNKTEHKVQYICALDTSRSLNVGSLDRLQELLGFNPANFLPAVWEVLPWSWLADYVFNITDLINAGVTSTSSVSWCNKTVTQVTTRNYSSRVDSTATSTALKSFGRYGSANGTLGAWTLRRTTLTRTPSVTLGMPDLIISLPIDGRKYLNAFAAVFSMRPHSEFKPRNPY